MTATKIIDGKLIAANVISDVRSEASKYEGLAGSAPCLAVVLVGEDPASAVYVRNKAKRALEVGFKSIQKKLPAEVTEAELKAQIRSLNEDPEVNGILVQLPLPSHIDETQITELIDPTKDVDGFHPINIGLLGAGSIERALVPCTPAGTVLLAKSVLGDDLTGNRVVIVGRSNIVGKPLTQLFLAENCTPTIAHSKTKKLEELCSSADILVAAVGRPEMIKGSWIKKGATVLDVGINRIPAQAPGKSKLVGDVDFESAQGIAGAITPVPGGVGPMTIAMLMKNTLSAACRQNSVELA